mmetsp:Transcript_3539/g.4162  ORF Transcript_3539/g.4162 Transcript_3539/m.4162 type:complete len:280 (-) Transcript_3539:109-948(-)
MGWYTLGHKGSIVLTEIRMNVQTAHLALLAGEAGDIRKGQGQILRLGVVVHQQNHNFSATDGFVEELPTWYLALVRNDEVSQLHVEVIQLDMRLRLLERTTTVTSPSLVHCNDFLVSNDVPHCVHDFVVGHIQRQGQRRRNDSPGAEMRSSFEEGQTGTSHLQHVRICPAARLRQVLLCKLDGGQKVPHNAAIGGPHIARGPEEVPRAPGRIWHGAAPMAVLNHNRSPGLVEEIRPLVQIRLSSATIQLHCIEAEDGESCCVALIHCICGRILRANAIV